MQKEALGPKKPEHTFQMKILPNEAASARYT
jgi:hypothetical protein